LKYFLLKIFVEYFYIEKVFKAYRSLKQRLKVELLGSLFKKGCIGVHRSTEIEICLGSLLVDPDESMQQHWRVF